METQQPLVIEGSLLPQLANGHVHVAVLLHDLGHRHLEVFLCHVDASLPQRKHTRLCAHRLNRSCLFKTETATITDKKQWKRYRATSCIAARRGEGWQRRLSHLSSLDLRRYTLGPPQLRELPDSARLKHIVVSYRST